MADPIKPLFTTATPVETSVIDRVDDASLHNDAQPVTVTVVGNKAEPPDVHPLTTGTPAMTPDHQPNLIVRVVSPSMAIFVRFGNLFLTQFVGLIVAGMTPQGGRLLYTSDFTHLLVLSASLAFPGAMLGCFKDLVTIFSRLEDKYPLATGNI